MNEDDGASSINTASQEQLVDKIHGTLQTKRYLVVFDDVRENDFWGKIEGVIREDHNRRSRILFTTRYKQVADSLAAEGRALPMEQLPIEEACRLFSRMSLWPDHPNHLQSLIQEIASKCEQLPLAIVAAANVMSNQKKEEESWERALKTLNSKLNDGEPSDGILMHCYFELPSHLKPCFLYCIMFPEGHMIKRKQLMRLWVAEGFIKRQEDDDEDDKDEDKSLEEIAEDRHLQQLIKLEMILVERRNESGGVRACSIHDRYRKVAQAIARKQRFLVAFDGNVEKIKVGDRRRLSLHNALSLNLKKDNDLTQLRSLFAFANAGEADLPPVDDQPKPFLSWKYKLLRVIELRDLPIKEVPSWVFEMYNLRYLGLRNTKIALKEFPKEIERLQQLRTLDLWKTHVESLPRNVFKLQNLEHLMLHKGINARGMTYHNILKIRGREAPKHIWDMKKLHTLKTIIADDELVKNLPQLEDLRTLLMTKIEAGHCTPLFESLGMMSNLRHLTLKAVERGGFELHKLPSPRPSLRKLQLNGSISYPRGWFQGLRNLTHLYLFDSSLTDESFLTELQSLPELAILVIHNAYLGKLLFDPSFPNLQILYLEDISMSSVVINSGSLPLLRKLHISRCRLLKTECHGIKNLTKLREIWLQETSTELKELLRPICSDLNVTLKIKERE